MTSRLEIPSGAALAEAEAMFDALLKVDALRRSDAGGEGRARPVPLSRLYDYATQAPRGDDAGVEEALERDPRLAADLRLLLERTALRQLPRAAAAAAGPLRERHGDGCRVRLQPSRAEPGQVYVIIEMAPGAETGDLPRALFVCDAENRCRRHALPEPRDGVIQLLAETQSDLVRGLEDIKTEIYLR
jgi:hypothetical protein